jgi:hypothetical protein
VIPKLSNIRMSEINLLARATRRLRSEFIPTFLPTLARVLDLKESPKRTPGTLSAIQRVSASTSPTVKRVLITPQEPLTVLLLVLVLGAEAFPVPMVAIFI